MKDSRRQRRMKCIMAWILMILMIFGDQTLINAAQSLTRSGADGIGAQQNAPMGIPEQSGSPMEMLGGHFTDPADMVDTDSVTTGKDLEEPDLDPEEIAPAGEISTGTEDGYAYSTEGSEVAITGYTGDETALMIPETISGMNVTEIKDKAFKGKTPLISVSFPRNLKKIGKNSFEGCTSLSSVTLSENVIQIDDDAFKDCSSLSELDLPESLQEIGSSFIAGTGIKSITIPQNVKEKNTSEYPLSGAEYLTDVTFAEGMTRIPKHFCQWNTAVSESAIRKVTIPESVTEIGMYAFENCRNLPEMDLRKVRKLGYAAFKGCVRLRRLYFREAVDDVGNNVFSDCPDLILQLSVPCRLLEVAIANNIPLEMDKLSHRLIDPDQSYYTLNSASNTGDLDHVIKYEIAKPYRGALSSKVISIALPPNLTFKENSVTVDNSKADYAYEPKNHTLRIPVSRDSGLIHFMAKPDTVSRVTSAVFLECEEGGETDREMIGLLDTEMPIITLRCDTTVSKAVFPVRGETMGQSTVRFTIDGAEAGVTSANKAGQYSTSLTLPSPAEGKTYAVTAYVQKEDETLSQNVMVNYNTQKPVVQEFKLIYYQHSTKALEYDLLNNSTGIGTLVYNPGYGYTFKVRFSLPEKIHSLYVTSTRNGKTAKLEAVWNPDLEAFVTHGRFNNDRNYVPGDLGLAVNTTIPKTKPQTPFEREETTKQEVSEIISQLTDEQKEDFKNNTEIRVNDEKTFEADQTLATGDVVSYRVDRYTSDPEVYKDLVERKEIEEDTGYLNIHRTLSGRYPSYASHDGTKKTYLVRYTNRSYVTLSYDYNTRAWFREEIQSKCERDLGEIFADNIKGALEGDLKNLIFKDFAPVLDAAGTTFDWLNDRAELMAAHQNAIGMTRQEIELALVMTDTFYVSRMVLIGAGVILGIVFPEGAVIIAVAGFAAGIILDILEDLAYENFDKLFAIYLKWIIDPSGYVYSAVTDHKLSGITATVYYKDTGTGEAVSWDAAEYGQQNPQLTTEDGVYFWNVPEGLWRVGFSSGDYEPRETDWMEVPPPQTDIAVELAPSFAPALVSANAFEDRVSLTFNQYMKPEGFKSLVLQTAAKETVPYSVEYDRTKTAQDGTVYADECLLRFEERLEGGTRLRLSGSTPLESAYGKKLSLEPFEMTCLCSVKINASEKPEIKAGSTEKIPIRISAGAEYAGRLTVEAQNPSILTAEDRIVEEEGRYYLKVTGCMYGESEVYVRDGNVTVLALHVRVDDETHFGSLVYQISFFGGDDATGIPPETMMEEEGTVILLPDNPFTAEERQFLGWSDGSVTLKPGDPYTVKAEDVRFTAIWKTSGSDEEPVKPVDPHDGGEGVEEGDLPDGRTAPKGIWIGGLKKSYPYTGSAIKPVFRVYYGEKRLTAGTDYTVGFKDNKNVGTNAKVTVKLKGDFSGSKTVNFEIVKNDLSSSGVTAEPLVAAYKKGKKNDNVRPVLTLNGVRLKYGKNDLSFTYRGASSNEAGGCTEVGDYIVKVAAAGSSALYAGFIDVPLTVTDKPVMSAVKITADRKAMAYTGEKQMPSFTLKYKGQPLAEGTYAMKTVSGDDYTEPGNHTVIFEGNNKDVFGRKAVTFRVTGKRKLGDSFAAVEIISSDLIDGKVPFAAGGAKPSVKASYKGEILKAGRDYTVSYRGNKKAGSSAAAIVKGKGRYGGSKTVHFTVGERDLKTLLLFINDRPVSAKNKDYEKTGILFTDQDFRNQKLKAGRDYTAEFTVSSGSSTPGAGETVSVKITARPGGNYTGVTEASFSIIEKEKDLSRARVVVNGGKPYAYTGKAITPSGNEVAVTLNGQPVGSDQYEISAFNNVAKGNNAMLV
ncbi:MAG: leucine-rich repeat domain-containing protein, partial [Lachnospiraceae bacterium]|nr:leucine-rich repeat domain-containing protein [Lachnospiraceae bacterium]